MPSAESMIAEKFPGAQFRMVIHGGEPDYATASAETVFTGQKPREEHPLWVIRVKPSGSFCMSFLGEVNAAADSVSIPDPELQFLADSQEALRFWAQLSRNLTLEGDQKDVAAIRDILPWFGMNALTHYLTPYGLEQFSGAAWGTRDVSQGPIDLLLHLGKYDEARQLLCTIFSNQHPDGGWSQWWMFDSYAHIRAHEAHGDIIYWCIIALASYIRITGDTDILNEELPYFDDKGPTHKKSPLKEHMERLISMITNSFIPDTAMVPFGGGDWNDSLQPVSEELAQRMISSWTVQMNYQAFDHYRHVYLRIGERELAEYLEDICKRIKNDFNRYLVKDHVVAGYGLVEKDGSISVLLHPSDGTTGISYSVLPMNRGVISGVFTPDQAKYHQQLVEDHLKGPDGVRLMDRPVPYQGGIQRIFQRAESSTFFGREIGLMYIHEHIRYAEALAITGKPDAFVKALRQAIPVDYKHIVPSADHRQANCYYSSSDVAFKTRYEADERYTDVLQGKMPLKGGWRVYSSGPGIFIGLIVTRFLGLRVEESSIVIDPVMPVTMDGLVAAIELIGFPLRITYRIAEKGSGVKTLMINGGKLPFDQEKNPYRKGGAIIPVDQFRALMNREKNTLEIEIH
jgi:cellobiose phosphorylase